MLWWGGRHLQWVCPDKGTGTTTIMDAAQATEIDALATCGEPWTGSFPSLYMSTKRATGG